MQLIDTLQSNTCDLLDFSAQTKFYKKHNAGKMATATHPNCYRWGVEKSSLLEHAEKVRQRSNNSKNNKVKRR